MSIKKRIIINIYDDTPEIVAVDHVKKVMQSGRISKLGASYCLLSLIKQRDGTEISVQADHIPSSGSDTFRVWSCRKIESKE